MEGGKFRFGLVGAGVIGPFHAEAIRDIPEAELTVVADTVPEKARKLAEQFGCDWTDDWRTLLEREDVDIVDICTPSGLHGEVAVPALEAGKHVVVEKPLEITLEKCDRIIEAARRNNRKVCVIFQSRFRPAYQKVKRAIEEGKFGRLVFGAAYVEWYRSQEYYDSGDWRGTWALDGGGALMNQSIHYVDLLQWMMGPVDTVFAFCDTLAHVRIEVEDVAVAALRFKNGALGYIFGTTAMYPGLSAGIKVVGENGTAVVDDGEITVWAFKGEEEEVKKPAEEKVAVGAASATAGMTSEWHRRQLEDFISALKEGREPLVNAEEGRKSVEIILAIYESARRGEPVRLPLK